MEKIISATQKRVVNQRILEFTSMQRAVGFNKVKVGIFFNVLKKLLYNSGGAQAVPQTNTYKVEKSGYAMYQKSQRIVAKKGRKIVGILTSPEPDKKITVACCASAQGMLTTNVSWDQLQQFQNLDLLMRIYSPYGSNIS